MNTPAELTMCPEGAVIQVHVNRNVTRMKKGSQRQRLHFLYGSGPITAQLPVHVIAGRQYTPHSIQGVVLTASARRETIETKMGDSRHILVLEPCDDKPNCRLVTIGSGEFQIRRLK